TRTHPAGVVAPAESAFRSDLAPRIDQPRDGARWLIRSARSETVIDLRASIAGTLARNVTWEIDGSPGNSRWVVTPGTHRFVALHRGHRSPVAQLIVVAPTS